MRDGVEGEGDDVDAVREWTVEVDAGCGGRWKTKLGSGVLRDERL